MTEEVETRRHPFRFMFKFLVFLGILAAAGKFLASKREEFAGLTEAEAKAKMESKLRPRFGQEKASEIANQVVPVLKEKGLLKDRPGEEMMGAATKAADNIANQAQSAAEDIADKAEDVVDKK
jgi:hypothetical protein